MPGGKCLFSGGGHADRHNLTYLFELKNEIRIFKVFLFQNSFRGPKNVEYLCSIDYDSRIVLLDTAVTSQMWHLNCFKLNKI